MKEYLMIRRLRCTECHRHHNELPDCLVPHKHYEAEVISGVLDGIVTSEDADSEDLSFPADHVTMAPVVSDEPRKY